MGLIDEYGIDPNDCLALVLMEEYGIDEIYTFDKGFKKINWVKVLP
ncbi:MAG: type II toxin-antitoxin system VapC family toxin [Thermoproteales archaeon]|nr:type II toxin-antitoxin system VapC family toxin [Thermoproteales archaeon]